MSLDPADAAELTETLRFIAGWLSSDPSLTASLLDYVGHPCPCREPHPPWWEPVRGTAPA